MPVPVFRPQVSVVLKKNIGRATIAGTVAASERFKGTAREIDLTPYLGDAGVVVVSKSVRQPAGMFSVTLADKMAPNEFESLYGLIEPMDIIEIRMARETQEYAAALDRNMPVMMRGFVTDVRRNEAMVGGRPQRSVTICGHDYGKILQICVITYRPENVNGGRVVSRFPLLDKYGVGVRAAEPAGVFVADVIEKIVTPFLDDMRKAVIRDKVADNRTPVMNIGTDILVLDGAISPFGVQDFIGPVYDLLRRHGDGGPWNEVFIEDREDAPYLVYRPNPFKDPEGNFLQEPYISDRSKAPAVVPISDVEIVGLDVARTDSNVANYYWVDGPRYALTSGTALRLYATQAALGQAFYLTDYPNSSPSLYGFREMEYATQQGERYDGQPEEAVQRGEVITEAFLNRRRAVLMDSNRDNVVFEAGRMTLRGNEQIRAGRMVRVARGGFSWEGYAYQVTHEFAPFRSYTTTVEFDRGTGFIERVQRGNGPGAPYLSEIGAGGVYQ